MHVSQLFWSAARRMEFPDQTTRQYYEENPTLENLRYILEQVNLRAAAHSVQSFTKAPSRLLESPRIGEKY